MEPAGRVPGATRYKHQQHALRVHISPLNRSQCSLHYVSFAARGIACDDSLRNQLQIDTSRLAKSTILKRDEHYCRRPKAWIASEDASS